MPSLELLRHGSTGVSGRYNGHTDVPLCEMGWQQMREAVAGRRWHRIVSSPLRRCHDFALELSRRIEVPLSVDARWMELHFGAWEGRDVADLPGDELAAFWRDPVLHTPPDAEPLTALQSRVIAAAGALRASIDSDERVLVITHGGPMRVLRAAQQGMSLREALNIEVPLAALWPLDIAHGDSC